MGWFLANAFLLAVVLLAAGYTWLAFGLLKLFNLHEVGLILLIGFAAALVATYFTAKRLHGLIAKFV